MNLLFRTLVKYFTHFKPVPGVPPVPQQRNDPGQPQHRKEDVEVPQTFQS